MPGEDKGLDCDWAIIPAGSACHSLDPVYCRSHDQKYRLGQQHRQLYYDMNCRTRFLELEHLERGSLHCLHYTALVDWTE